MSWAAAAADLPASEVPRQALGGVLTEIDKILEEQADFRANKQMSTQRLQTLLNQGGKLATVLRTIAKQHYGHGNDKLVQFGVQPLRSRPKPTVEPPTPAEGGPTPPTSTTPSTSK